MHEALEALVVPAPVLRLTRQVPQWEKTFQSKQQCPKTNVQHWRTTNGVCGEYCLCWLHLAW